MHPWSSGQDAGFSLRNDGFDSRWVYHLNTGETRNGYPHQTVNLALIEDCEFEPHLSHHFENQKMGCKCCWGHAGFASLKDRFDPGTVHHFSGNSAAWLARLPWTQEVREFKSHFPDHFIRVVSSVGRAADIRAPCHRFESCTTHHFIRGVYSLGVNDRSVSG